MNRKSHNKGQKFPAEPLTRDEVIALMNVCSRRAPTSHDRPVSAPVESNRPRRTAPFADVVALFPRQFAARHESLATPTARHLRDKADDFDAAALPQAQEFICRAT